MRNLSNLQVINSFKSVYNLSPNIGHDYKDLFEKYDIENILDFNFYLDTEDKYRIEDGHPNELWYEQYSEYLYKELKSPSLVQNFDYTQPQKYQKNYQAKILGYNNHYHQYLD